LNNEDGDIEGIKDFQNCNPTAIECKTVRGKSYKKFCDKNFFRIVFYALITIFIL
jgi:hypothetical protein